MTSATTSIAANLARVREQIADAARAAGREPAEITLVAVSKTHPPEAVAEAILAGVTHLGENRVQEAAAKLPLVASLLPPGTAQPVWHLVGHLQTNKARQAAQLFGYVESVDSLRVAQVLGRARTDQPLLPVLVEVYLGDDPARPGLRPEQLTATIPELLNVQGIEICGLMTVAPLGWDAQATRGAFRQLRRLRDQLAERYGAAHFRELSMGMSEDFPIAVQEGATIVRIGTAIFGPRETPFTA